MVSVSITEKNPQPKDLRETTADDFLTGYADILQKLEPFTPYIQLEWYGQTM
jgi:hypothetical protein